MSARSLQDQIDGLLNKKVVQPKVSGVPSPDVETASVVESLTLALMTQPRSAFFAYYLARNGLLTSISKEVEAIDTLSTTINDLANTTYAIKDTKALKRAQAAMLQLSTQGQVSSDSSAFARYSIAVDDFLNTQLAKNIKSPDSTDMVRPGEEAGLSLPGDLTTVKDSHSDFLDRLYALAVGVSNFVSTPFSSLVGANAIYRAKKDLDSLVEEIEADESGSQSRDAAVRLIASRATIKTVGSSVDMTLPVVDTARHIPSDVLLTGKSEPTAVTATTTTGPFILSGGGLSVTIGGTTVTTSLLNQAGNAAAVLGESVSYPVSVPANYHLFIHLKAIDGLTWVGPVYSTSGPTNQGTYSEGSLGDNWLLENGVYSKTLKVVLNSGSTAAPPSGVIDGSPRSCTLSDILTAINLALGSYGSAVEFVGTGSNRILITATDPKIQAISIVPTTYTMETQGIGYAVPIGDPLYGATVFWPRIYSNSFHSQLGFTVNQSGELGSTPVERVFEALKIVFASVLTFDLNANDSITFNSIDTFPGVELDLSGSALSSLGLLSNYVASSSIVELLDENGSVVSPIGRVDTGDTFESSSGQSTIARLSSTNIELADSLQTFEGSITVISALYLVWLDASTRIQEFLSSWVNGPYSENLAKLDQLIAILIGSPSSPRRSEALALLNDLKAKLLGLQTSLQADSATLPVGSASKEKTVISNVVSVFTERKFDRALDLLMRCKLQEIFEIDWQSASYSGNLMKSVESIAQSDVKFPDMNEDEGFEVLGVRKVGP